MHRQVGARRWARLLGAAVLGGALSAGVIAALPAEATTVGSATAHLSSGIDLSNLTEEGSYGSGGLSDSDANGLANGLEDGDGANGLSNGDTANGLSSGDFANGLANGLKSSSQANGLANGLAANGL
ncbi:MAG TPA: hypothetical protein VFU98_07090 [Microlunatus sp.]|nr:hypothetical protein [Microlunatus sp.]